MTDKKVTVDRDDGEAPDLTDKDQPVGRAIRVHPVFLTGVVLFVAGVGALMSANLSLGLIVGMSLGATVGALVWMTLGMAFVVLGVIASYAQGLP